MRVRDSHRRKSRLQAAVEYLSTYGWALLIIAVLFVVIYEFGLANLNNSSLRAMPGSCKVVKQGSLLPSLVGICSGEAPEYVASLNSKNGGYFEINSSKPFQILHNVTVSVWFKMPNSLTTLFPGTNIATLTQAGSTSTYSNSITIMTSGGYLFSGSGGISTAAMATIPNGAWVNYVLTMTSSTICHYINGTLATGVPFPCYSTSGNPVLNFSGNNALLIGAPIASIPFGNGRWILNSLNGSVANIQIYNSTFTANEVSALYSGGIGGPPVSLQSIVGWWPLNGNGNDYSGNSYNANVVNSIVFSTQWITGYTIH